jgi:hypothetical protein
MNNNPFMRIRCNNWDAQENTCSGYYCWYNISGTLPAAQGSPFNDERFRAGNEWDWTNDNQLHKMIIDMGGNLFTYFHHRYDPAFPSVIPVGGTFINDPGFIGYPKSSNSCDPSFFNIAELYLQNDSLMDMIDSLGVLYEYVVQNLDFGKTQELLDLIADSALSSGNLADSLVLYSPLSSNVLSAYIERPYSVNDTDFVRTMIRNLPVEADLYEQFIEKTNTLSDILLQDNVRSVCGYNPYYQCPRGIALDIDMAKQDLGEVVLSLIDSLIESDSIADLIDLLWTQAEFTSKADAVGSAFTSGNLSLAYEMLSGLEPGTTADSSLKYLLDLAMELQSEGKSWFSLDSTNQSEILLIASDTQESSSRQMARCILKLIKGIEFDPEEYDFGEGARFSGNNWATQTNYTLTPRITFKMYPNPADHELHIELPAEHAKGGILICDLSGKLLCSYAVDGAEAKHILNTENLGSGLYLVHIRLNDMEFRRKLVVHHNN